MDFPSDIKHQLAKHPHGSPPSPSPEINEEPMGRQLIQALKQLPRELRIHTVRRGAEDRGAVEAWRNVPRRPLKIQESL